MPDVMNDDALQAEIARRAYARFCDRGCVHGADVDDWIAAEREVLAEKTASTTGQAGTERRSRRRTETIER